MEVWLILAFRLRKGLLITCITVLWSSSCRSALLLLSSAVNCLRCIAWTDATSTGGVLVRPLVLQQPPDQLESTSTATLMQDSELRTGGVQSSTRTRGSRRSSPVHDTAPADAHGNDRVRTFLHKHRPPSASSSQQRTASVAADTLQLGHDVLGHFAEHGLDAAPRLVHCITAHPAAAAGAAAGGTQAAADRAPAGPYDLLVVPHRQQLLAGRGYATVSAAGVVLVRAGVGVTCWMR